MLLLSQHNAPSQSDVKTLGYCYNCPSCAGISNRMRRLRQGGHFPSNGWPHQRRSAAVVCWSLSGVSATPEFHEATHTMWHRSPNIAYSITPHIFYSLKMIAATHTLGSRSFLRGPQVRATGPQQAQRARTVSRIVCEDAPEKKSAVKAKAATLRYEKCSALCRTTTAGGRRGATGSMPTLCKHIASYLIFVCQISTFNGHLSPVYGRRCTTELWW